MRVTQNDLSYDKVGLDYQALIQTARIAQGHCVREIHRHLATFDSLDLSKRNNLNAEYLEREAKMLSTVTETLHTLEGGLERSQVEIVNKPTEA